MKTETQPVTDFRGPPTRPGPAAFMTMKVPQFSFDMKSDERPDDTIDSGMGTLPSCGTSPALESILPDTMMDRGTMGGESPHPF